MAEEGKGKGREGNERKGRGRKRGEGKGGNGRDERPHIQPPSWASQNLGPALV